MKTLIQKTIALFIMLLFISHGLKADFTPSVYIDSSVPAISANDIEAAPHCFELFTHGRPGQLLINGKWLDKEGIALFLIKELSPQIRHINIYGCEFGKETLGLAAIHYLERRLQMSVSASDDITGVGGDWVLELSRGNYTSIVVPNYPYSLQTNLELSPPSASTNEGPTTVAQTATFYRNIGISETYTAFNNPPVTVTLSLSNQQFGPGAPMGILEGYTNGFGMLFGGSSNSLLNTTPFSRPLLRFIGEQDSAPENYSTTENNIGSGISLNTTNGNKNFYMFCVSDALISQATGNTPNRGFAINKYPPSSRVYYGDLTVTFSTPVSNPILHLSGIGGAVTYVTSGVEYTQGFSADLDLGNSSPYKLVKLSGNVAFNIVNNCIKNTAAQKNAAGGAGTASGSALVRGENIRSLTFKVYLQGDGGRVIGGTITPNMEPIWSLDDSPEVGVGGDSYGIGFSLNLPIDISGNVFNDPNGGNVNNSSGASNVVPDGMYAILTDSTGDEVAFEPVNTDGSFIFHGIFPGRYTIVLTTIPGVWGEDSPESSLPGGWENTGEFTGPPNTGNDGVVNGNSSNFDIVSSDLTNINFGIRPLMVLAANLRSITAGRVNGTKATRIDWAVANELSFSHYILERSLQQNAGFVVVSDIAVTGIGRYSYLDNEAGTGMIFYRLRLVNLDGKYGYSNVVPVRPVSGGRGALNVFPNPAYNTVSVGYDAAQKGYVTINLFDMTGRAVIKRQQKVLTGYNLLKIDNLDLLAKGHYKLQIEQDAKQYTTTVEIQK